MEWTLIIEVVGVIGGIATLIALMLGPMFYLGSKLEKLKDDMNEIKLENKDFHHKLLEIERKK